jgi:protein-disulfide isomerase-like protein with CxxC motif
MKRRAITTSRKRAAKMAAAIVREQLRRVRHDGYREGRDAAREEFTRQIRPARGRTQLGPAPVRPFVQVWMAPPVDPLYFPT